MIDHAGRFSPLKTAAFAALFLPAIWMASEVVSGNWDFPSPYVPLIYHSGVWATWLLLLSLLVTPLRRILRWNGLIAVRRMIGVAALAYSVAHLVIWFGLRMWDPASLAAELGGRLTLWVATVALIGLAVLGATSLDGTIRRMGGRAWRRLHRSVYWLAGLAVLHFLLSPGSISGLPFLMFGSYCWLMAWRLLERQGAGSKPLPLLGLALATALGTALFEVLWVWAYQAERALYPPIGTLAANFDWQLAAVLGPSPSWVMLALGLLASGLALFGETQRGVRVPQHS